MARKPDRVSQAIQRLSPAELHRFVDTVAAVLYWDPDKEKWDPNKEWEGADFLDMINENIPATVLEAIRRKR